MHCVPISKVVFPTPAGRKCNMMPIILGDSKSIPKHLRNYVPMIHKCIIDEEVLGKVGFLSVQESFVCKNESQRRPGLHTEAHPNSSWGQGGWGKSKSQLKGGLFIASSCFPANYWNLEIFEPGPEGDCEFLRPIIGQGKKMKNNHLFWLTDHTLHEAIPQTKACYRQWFRLVVGRVDLWYEQHSTKNPLGIQLPRECRIIKTNKFESTN